MFLHMCVILFTGNMGVWYGGVWYRRGCLPIRLVSAQEGVWPGVCLPRRVSAQRIGGVWADTLFPRDGNRGGRYSSYWNAFLLFPLFWFCNEKDGCDGDNDTNDDDEVDG